MKKKSLFVALSFLAASATAQIIRPLKSYTRADTLRGSVTGERAWWNVLHYDLHVEFNLSDSSLIGYNVILYQVLRLPPPCKSTLMPRWTLTVFSGWKKNYL